jgi:hypothetical protein
MSSISYTAVILDEKSRSFLATEFKHLIPEGWEWIAHHMTICLGSLNDEIRKDLLGYQAHLMVESFGINDKVMAVGVSGMLSNNKKPHITLAVNRADGGKPYMSNGITEWTEVSNNLILTGIVEEVENQNDIMEKKKLNEIVNINDLPFLGDVKAAGGKIYQVGGAVRDTYLNKVSKDLDIVITGVPQDKLKSILSKYGKADLVGDSFGVIKFTPPGGDEIDIAIPRTERAKKQIVVTLGQNDIFIEYNDSINERELKG